MNGPIRILHVAGGRQIPGSDRFLLQMTDHTDPEIYRLAVCVPERDSLLEEELKRRHVPYEVIPLGLAVNPFALRRLSKLAREWRPTLVQSHGLRASLYARLAAPGAPVVSTIHNPLGDAGYSLPRRLFLAAADRATGFRAAAVVCTAECLREEFLRRCPDLWERTHVIPIGVDLERFEPRRRLRDLARRSLDLDDEHWTILCVGRLSRTKGQDVLLNALRSVKKALPPFRLFFAGEGPRRAALARQADELGLGGETRFLGERRDIPELLSAADVVVLPYLREGLPHALLEALAMERPVIASQVGGITEVMARGEEGVLVPPRSAEKLAEGLLKVLWDRDGARERAVTGRRRVEGEFDVKKMIARWDKLYRALSGDLLIA